MDFFVCNITIFYRYGENKQKKYINLNFSEQNIWLISPNHKLKSHNKLNIHAKSVKVVS